MKSITAERAGLRLDDRQKTILLETAPFALAMAATNYYMFNVYDPTMFADAEMQKKAAEDKLASAQALLASLTKAERERLAGITKGLNGADAVLDAMAANTKKAKESAAADNLRSGVLGKTTETDDAIKAALDEVEGTKKPQSLADKLAALKKN